MRNGDSPELISHIAVWGPVSECVLPNRPARLHPYLHKLDALDFEGALQAHRSRRAGVLHAIGEAVVSSAAEHSSRCFLAYTAPLLEEKRDFRCLTLFPNRKNPLLFHRTRPWATFPADRSEERRVGKECRSRWS